MNKRSFAHRMNELMKQTLEKTLGRRSFLKAFSSITAGSVLAGTIMKKNSDKLSLDDYFQKHYKEMKPEDKKRIFARIEKELGEKYNRPININDPAPQKNVKFVYALNLSTCNGSRKCVTACAQENNIDPSIGSYITVLEMPHGSLNLEKGDKYYQGESVPNEGMFYLPVQCNHCNNPPCTKVCPVEATWKEEDGLVVVDYDWCIGCRYCQAACPYEARHFNFASPKLDSSQINTEQSYLSNRIRKKGVMEKCTFCLHRSRQGQYPACLEACPTGARKFGNILDKTSEVYHILKNKRVFVLKEELNTLPQFYYYFD